ncbi:hypothetical protein BGW80DRAFT_1408867, partial [Lactifluus volemus]
LEIVRVICVRRTSSMSIALEIAQTQRVTLFSDVNSREERGKETSYHDPPPRFASPKYYSTRRRVTLGGASGGVRGKQPDVSRKRRWTRPRPSPPPPWILLTLPREVGMGRRPLQSGNAHRSRAHDPSTMSGRHLSSDEGSPEEEVDTELEPSAASWVTWVIVNLFSSGMMVVSGVVMWKKEA